MSELPGIPPLNRPGGWRGWFYDQCPACDRKFWNSNWNAFFYPLHYAEIHLGIPCWRKL